MRIGGGEIVVGQQHNNAALRALGLGDIGQRLDARTERRRRRALPAPPPRPPGGWQGAIEPGPHPSSRPSRPYGVDRPAPAWLPHDPSLIARAAPPGPAAPWSGSPWAVPTPPSGHRLTPPLHRAPPRAPAPTPPVEPQPPKRAEPWDVLTTPRRESWWIRARRACALGLVIVVVIAGALSIARSVTGWLTPPTPPAPTAEPSIPDSALLGAALPFAVDYLSWDSADRTARQTALARQAAPATAVDGWDGTGTQLADSPVPIDLARQGADRAVVTVRVRVTPYAPAGRPPPPRAAADQAPNVAAGPRPGAGTAQQPRWLNLALPLQRRDGRIVVTARPVLVGSVPAAPALPDAGTGDTTYARDTRSTITTLLRAYGAGDLEFVRAAGTSFDGLDNAAALDNVVAWRVANVVDGTDPSTRVGAATVVWQLPDSGKLSCTYRVELKSDNGRWYLLSIGAEMEDVG